MGTLALYPLQNYIIIGISDVSQEKNAKSAEWRYFIGNSCPQRAEPDGMSSQIRHITTICIKKCIYSLFFPRKCLILHIPESTNWIKQTIMLICPFHWLTGLNCPFCGAQRMVLALLHGNVTEAFWLNPGLAVGALLVGAWWLWKREISSRAALVMLGIAILWGIIRNIMQL